ncbi:diguanylate cyclase [Candidatus Saccharibacteria bacterium]|nr:diguanylate cyclase [Candidatus Saccharibacteria bacterium]
MSALENSKNSAVKVKVHKSFYDPAKTFDDNFDFGPFATGEHDKPYKNSGRPQHKVLGKKVHSPFGMPAGPLPNSKFVKYAFDRGFDVICYKTQRSVPFACNEFPNVLYLDVDGDLTLEKAAEPIVGKQETDREPHQLTITNSFGNPSRGPEFWVDDLRQAVKHQGEGQLLIMSVVGSIKDGFSEEDYWDDFAHTAELAASSGVEAIELNLSCPNVATEGVICYTPQAVIEISRRTKEKVGNIPVIAKFGYFSADQQELLEDIVAKSSPYLAAYSAINTIAAPVVDEYGQQALPGEGRLKSGSCGAGVKWAGLDMAKRLDGIRRKNNYDYEIIGVGGVMSADDYQAYRQAGADIVQSATGAMWNPQLAGQVKETI